MLNESGELLLKDKDIADISNEYFGRDHFSYVLPVVSARSALFEKWNPIFLLKTPKTHVFKGVQRSKCLKFEKIRGKNTQLCAFTGLSCLFLVIPQSLFGSIVETLDYIYEKVKLVFLV